MCVCICGAYASVHLWCLCVCEYVVPLTFNDGRVQINIKGARDLLVSESLQARRSDCGRWEVAQTDKDERTRILRAGGRVGELGLTRVPDGFRIGEICRD